ncbi:MAG: hypothetical protein QE271_12295 [Bacteriovoracaceae bacterium]|nr:hypothetical protein [Bacteriovoracaceae bacterium]
MNFSEINSSSNPRILPSYENEWKGLLFEYLVASAIAEKYSLQKDFHNTLPLNLIAQLDRYQKELYQSSPLIYERLTCWPKIAANYFHQRNPLEKMMAVSLGQKNTSLGHEGDIFIKSERQNFWISLKLAKMNSFINTKSGGVKSFLINYFPGPQTQSLQNDFNEQSEIDFYQFAKQLHELRKIPFSGNFQNWRQAHLTELPGELPKEEHNLFSQFMVKQISNLKEKLKIIFENDPTLFLTHLRPLVGITHSEIIPFYIYHQEDDLTCFIPDYKRHLLSSFSWKQDNHDIFSFSLDFDQFELQIRLKPMNKFTAPSPKVNCSVKWKVS